jgi:hypothetical protein
MLSKGWIKAAGVVVMAMSSSAFAAETIKLNCPAGTKQVNTSSAVACVKPGPSKSGGLNSHGPMVLLEKGKKAAEGQTENGFRTGAWTFYDETGTKVGTANFKGGNYHGEVTYLFPSGKVRKVEQFSEGLRHGTVKEFAEDGKLVKQTEYRDNRAVADK